MKTLIIAVVALVGVFLATAYRTNLRIPEFTVFDLARAQGITPILIEFPAELMGKTIYYEYSTAEGPIDWGRAFEVPAKASYVKAFVHREARGVSYVTDEVAYGLLTFGKRTDAERYPYFNFSPGAEGRPIAYKDFKLAFGATWHAPHLAIGGGQTPGNPENHDWFLVRLVDSLPDGFIVEAGDAEDRRKVTSDEQVP